MTPPGSEFAVQRESDRYEYPYCTEILDSDDVVDDIYAWCQVRFGIDPARWDIVQGWIVEMGSCAVRVRFQRAEDHTLFVLTWVT